MRNLKRALSLTLASVMLLGMMVVGSSAAGYPDVDDTHNVEAIEVLQAIGVMVGDDNGNFGPDDQVNRAQMAVVMALLLDLDYDYYKGTNPFWDVPSWAEPYVAACYANGIVSGYNATTYGAGDPVTAVQAASMMMRALGYFQYQSDYKDGFELATVRQASKISLLKDVNAASNTSALTRNQVAQLALNTLETAIVDANDNTLSINTGVNAGNISITGGQVDYVVRTSTEDFATVINNSDQGGTTTTGRSGCTVELGEQLFQGDLKKFGDKKGSYGLSPDPAEIDDMGRPAVRWVYNNKDIGTYVEDNDLKFSYTAKAAKGDMYTKIGASVADELRAGGSSKYDLEVYVDGAKVTAPDGKDYFEKNSSSAAGTKTFSSADVTGGTGRAGVSGNGVLTEVYMIDGGSGADTVRIVMTNTYLLKATSDYNSTRETVNVETVEINTDATAHPGEYPLAPIGFDTSISNDDFNVAGVKENDYLLATYSYKTGDYVTVEPAELLSGEVSEYTVTDYVIMDGTKYNYSKVVGLDEKSEEFSINQDAKVVLDKYGYIIFVDEAISTNSFVYIQKVAGTSGLNKKGVAAAYFGDGTSAEIDLKKVVDAAGNEHTDGTYLSNTPHGWYTYIKDSNDQYTLTAASRSAGRTTDRVFNNAVSAATNATQIAFNNKVRFMNQTAGVYTDDAKAGVRVNANTVFLVLDDDDELTVSTGVSDAPDVFIGGSNHAVAANKVEINWVIKDNYAQYVFIDVSDPAAYGTVDSAVNAADYLFILKATGNKTVVEGDTYFKFKVVIDGEETERFIEESNVAKVGELRYNVKTNSKDYITKASLVTSTSKPTHETVTLDGSKITQKGKTITIAGTTYIIDNNTELNMVVGKGVTELLRDSGADYETYLKTTAGTIAGLIGQLPETKGVDGKAYAVVDEAGSEVLEVLWVYISDVSNAKEVVEGGSDSTSINDALNDPDNVGGATVSDPDLSGGVTVPADKTLVINGSTGAGTIAAGSPAAGQDKAAVALDNATVDGTLDLTAVDAILGNTAVEDTLSVTDVTLSGAVDLGEDAVLNIAGDVTVGSNAEITAAADAQIVIGAGADASALLDIAEFYEADGTPITSNTGLQGKTFTWRDEWTTMSMRATTHPAGWYAEDEGGSETTYTVTGITAATAVTNTTNENTFTVTASPAEAAEGDTVTLSVTLAKAVPADKKVTVTITAPAGIAPIVFAATEGTTAKTATFTMGTDNVTVAATAAEAAASTPACTHENLTKTDAQAATCTEDGNIDYWTCDDCGKMFSDAAATTEIQSGEEVTDATGHQNLTKTDAQAATCTEDGNIDYWTCDDCGKMFSDAAATTEIQSGEEVTDATGHTQTFTFDTGSNPHTHSATACSECNDSSTAVTNEECVDSDSDGSCDKCTNSMT